MAGFGSREPWFKLRQTSSPFKWDIMKIDHIEVINLKYDYPDAQRFRYAGGICDGRLTSLILVHTDTGHIGVGSAYSHPLLIHLIIKHDLEHFLRGEDPREVETLWDRMYRITRWYGRKGAAMTALGALDTAFWDLRGQALDKPVWSLLGGKEASCPAYASALLWKEPHELAAEAAAYIENGFRRVKMRLGRSEAMDRRAVETVRQAIGPENDLIVDASMRYSPAVARRMGEFLAHHHVFWLEEPFQPEALDSYSGFRGTMPVRIAAGENEFGVQGFQELIRTEAVDILQPDASRCGGITEVVRVAHLAEEAGLKIATHSWSDAVAIIANAHVIAAVENGITVEIDKTGNPFVNQLAGPLRIANGQLHLPAGPGLGIQLNQDVIDQFRMDSDSIPHGSYSDMIFGKASFQPAGPYEESL